MAPINFDEGYVCGILVSSGDGRVCIEVSGIEIENDGGMLVFEPKGARKLARALVAMARRAEGK